MRRVYCRAFQRRQQQFSLEGRIFGGVQYLRQASRDGNYLVQNTYFQLFKFIYFVLMHLYKYICVYVYIFISMFSIDVTIEIYIDLDIYTSLSIYMYIALQVQVVYTQIYVYMHICIQRNLQIQMQLWIQIRYIYGYIEIRQKHTYTFNNIHKESKYHLNVGQGQSQKPEYKTFAKLKMTRKVMKCLSTFQNYYTPSVRDELKSEFALCLTLEIWIQTSLFQRVTKCVPRS